MIAGVTEGTKKKVEKDTETLKVISIIYTKDALLEK